MPLTTRIVTIRLACGHTRAYTGAEAPLDAELARAGLYRCAACGGRVMRPTSIHTYEDRAAA